MKKRIVGMLLLTAMLGLAACAKPTASTESAGMGEKTESASEDKGSGAYELALITDVGTIDDKSFNQGSWEGLSKYAQEHGKTYKYYKPAEKSDDACIQAIDLAVKGGAKVIVTPGFLFETPIYRTQDKYPDVKFILIDASPQEGGNSKIGENVMSIFYAEEQAGYLAGYAAVTDGYRKLGFMGGIAVPAVVRFGYGYIQGADAAAKDLGLAAGEVSVKYTYVGNFDASPENQTKAAAWFNEGVECIFACGGGVGNSVMKAAEASNKAVIGVDVDQSGESATVITSAMKNLGDSVYNAVGTYYDNKFEGGKITNLDASENGVQLPMETSKFKTFTQENYDKLYEGLKDGAIKVKNDADVSSATELATDNVSVDLIQ